MHTRNYIRVHATYEGLTSIISPFTDNTTLPLKSSCQCAQLSGDAAGPSSWLCAD